MSVLLTRPPGCSPQDDRSYLTFSWDFVSFPIKTVGCSVHGDVYMILSFRTRVILNINENVTTVKVILANIYKQQFFVTSFLLWWLWNIVIGTASFRSEHITSSKTMETLFGSKFVSKVMCDVHNYLLPSFVSWPQIPLFLSPSPLDPCFCYGIYFASTSVVGIKL